MGAFDPKMDPKIDPKSGSPSLDTYTMITLAPKNARFADNHAGLRPVQPVEEINSSRVVLSDRNNRHEERPWVKWRLASERGRKALVTWKEQPRFQRWGTRMENCGTYLAFGMCPDGDGRWLQQANFCNVKVCPMCMWRRSKKLTAQVLKVAHTVQARQAGIRWIMLTVTIQNVAAGFGDEAVDKPEVVGRRLAEAFDTLAQGFDRLMRHRDVKKVVMGYYRTLEITRNVDENGWRNNSPWYGSYHPHMHILLAVPAAYFTRDYISQAEWTERWKKAAQLDYKPIVHVTRLRGKGKPETDYDDPLSGVLEVTKYLTKPNFLAPDKADWVAMQTQRTIAYAVVNRRLTGWGGVMRTTKAELRLEDAEGAEADLTHTDDDGMTRDCKCPVCNSNLIEEVYQWHVGRKQYERIGGPQ